MKKWSIPKPAHFDFEEILWFLDRGYDECLYEATATHVIKLIPIQDQFVLIKIEASTAEVIIQLLTDLPDELTQQALQYVLGWLDIERNLAPLHQSIAQHDTLSKQIGHIRGLRLIGIPDLFEALAWSVIGQQINLTFAYRLKRRLVEQYGGRVAYQGKSYYHFPSPEQIASCEVEELKSLQFSTRKAEYLIGIAQLMAEGKLSKNELMQLPDTQARIERLCKIRGIGEWTANYTLMKCLREMTCIPYGDAGLINAIKLVDGLAQKPDRAYTAAFFAEMSGWEAYTTFYLWYSLSSKKPNSQS